MNAIVAPPVSTPTYSAANPLPPAPKPVAPIPLPAVKPVAKPAPKPAPKPVQKAPKKTLPPLSKQTVNRSPQPSSWAPQAVSQPVKPTSISLTAKEREAINRMNAQYAPRVQMVNAAVNIVREVTPINDSIRLITGRDPETGAQVSRMAAAGWIALEFVPGNDAAKAPKLAKYLDTISDLAKGTKTLDKAKDAYRTGKTYLKNGVGKVLDAPIPFGPSVAVAGFGTVGSSTTLRTLGQNAKNNLDTMVQAYAKHGDEVVQGTGKGSKGASNISDPTFKSSFDIPKNDKGHTKSNLKLGQDVHKEYKVGEVLDGVRDKEYVLPSGKRADFIDWENKVVYELKPNNPNQIKKGTKQLQGYHEELEKMTGESWTGVLDTY